MDSLYSSNKLYGDLAPFSFSSLLDEPTESANQTPLDLEEQSGTSGKTSSREGTIGSPFTRVR